MYYLLIQIEHVTLFFNNQEAGLSIGGPDFNPYVMLEVHYNNPGLRGGIYKSVLHNLYEGMMTIFQTKLDCYA